MSIAFISTMAGAPWGGSEELWSQTALRLAEQGFGISASVQSWTPLHPRVQELQRRGIAIQQRPPGHPLWRRAAHRIIGGATPLHLTEVKQLLEDGRPALVVISDGGFFPAGGIAELCMQLALPFVTIVQANHTDWWPDDSAAQRYRIALAAALRCYFVSEANRRLAEKQIGCPLANAEVVRNPFNVAYDALPAWPTNGDVLRMACVGRLHPPSKGQDLLLEALAQSPWDARIWTLALYGDGPNKESLLRLAERLHLESRVEFRGHVDDVAGIWAENHLCVLPSRYEGLPLALIEALLCGRAAVVTDVAGNGEVVSDGMTGFVAESPTVPALHRALERAWMQRDELQRMGEAASRCIREIVPRDPVGVFVRKLRALVDNSADSRPTAGRLLTSGQV